MKKTMQFDDALPERLVRAGSVQEPKRLRINQSVSAPSPYVVKLTRDLSPSASRLAPVSVTDEITALAKSLIIDGDDEVVRQIEDDNELSLDALDISAQLREFDTALPQSAHHDTRRAAPTPSRPSRSLDEALSSLSEEPISLDALVPIASVTIEPTDDLIPEAPVSTPYTLHPRASSPWVAAAIPFASRRDTPARKFIAFEWNFLRHASFRALAAFVALSFVVVLPLHAMQTLSGSVQSATVIQDVGLSALDDVSRATADLSARDFGAAETKFSSAAEKFAQAQETLNDLHAGVVALVNVIPQTSRTYNSVQGLIGAGQELSQTASIMSQAGEGISSQTSGDIVSKLNVLSAYVDSALPHALAAEAALAKVDPSVIPAGYTAKVALLQSNAPAIVDSMQEFLKFVHTLTYLLGSDGVMRYLTLFQNNTELRPTGGFVGSFAEVAMNAGAIENIRLPGGGTYDVQGQLDVFVQAPKAISLISPRWEFQDGNWFPDFPTSAKKMQWFYEHAGGPTTDGVLAVNATFIEKILAITGPIEISNYGVTIDAENFLFTTEKIVEVDNGTTATPKAFLGDLVPLLLEKIQTSDTKNLLKLLSVVEKGLAERDIQVYFRDNDAEKAMQDLGYGGEVAQTAGDYLMVVNTNIGGGKTDAVIDQAVDQVVDISETGTIVDSVTITKTHRGMANALFTGKNNVDYIRIYVPQGSVLLSADGFEAPAEKLFEPSDIALSQDDDLSLIMSNVTKDTLSGVDIWDEFGKTVFAGWMQTAPGETQVVHFSYRIPQVLFAKDSDQSLLAQARRTLGFDNHDGYSLFVQKQSGVINRATTVHLNVPDAWKTKWTSNTEGDDVATVSTTNDHDHFTGWIFTR